MVVPFQEHVCNMFADLDTMMGATAEVGCTEFGDLPFGACEDPVRSIEDFYFIANGAKLQDT